MLCVNRQKKRKSYSFIPVPFKEINNFYGTIIGDMIIFEIGSRLKSVIDEKNAVFTGFMLPLANGHR